MRQVLFVDDESQVLDGLRKALRVHRARWKIETASGGVAGLAALAAGHFDAVVSDVRMPEMDGEVFLQEVQRRHPDVLRVVLSGDVRTEVAQRLSHIAHQFIPKPAAPKQVFELVDEALQARDLLSNPAMRQLVVRLGDLPTLPGTFSQVLQAINAKDVSFTRLAEIIQTSPAIAANVLRVVNSAYYGLPRKVTTVQEAVKLLGLEHLKLLVLSVEVYFGSGVEQLGLQLHEQATQRMRAVKRLLDWAQRPDLIPSAQTAAVLSDVGLILLASRAPAEFEKVCARVDRDHVSYEVAEQAVVGAHHGLLGGVLMGMWNLPVDVCQAVVLHHGPWTGTPGASAASALGLVVVAEELAGPSPESLRLEADLGALLQAFPGFEPKAFSSDSGLRKKAS